MIVPTTGQEDIFDYALRVGENGNSVRVNEIMAYLLQLQLMTIEYRF